MLHITIQYFGGRGGKGSGGSRANRIKNSSGAPERAVEILREGMEKVQTYGIGKVVINSSSEKSLMGTKNATSVVDKKFENQLTGLALENGYIVSFTTVNSKGTASQKLKYGSNTYVTKTKERVANFYKQP